MSDIEQDLQAAIGVVAKTAWLDPQRLAAQDWSCRTAAGEVGGIVLGHRAGRCVGNRDDRHILTVVGAGGGAATSLIVPNLLLYDGSMLVIDPTGELARMTARARREKGQTVVVLDPFGVSGMPTGCFNPLDTLDPESATVVDDAALIADALIVGSTREPHWTNGARVLLKAVILLTITLPAEERNLVMVRQLLSGDCQLIADVARRFELDPADTVAPLVALLKACKGVNRRAILTPVRGESASKFDPTPAW